MCIYAFVIHVCGYLWRPEVVLDPRAGTCAWCGCRELSLGPLEKHQVFTCWVISKFLKFAFFHFTVLIGCIKPKQSSQFYSSRNSSSKDYTMSCLWGWGWLNSSCSCRGPGFNSHNLNGGSQLLKLWGSGTFSDPPPRAPHTNDVQIYTQAHVYTLQCVLSKIYPNVFSLS